MVGARTPDEDKAAIELAMQFALDDILTHKKEPSQDDLAVIPPGEMTNIINALSEALKEDLKKGGELGTRKAFTALCKQHSWLSALKNKPIPSRPKPEDEQEQTEEINLEFVRDDALENMPPREWLIAGLLPKEGVAILFGQPGTYKSFLAIDWALSIGFGYGWLGKEVKKGGVAYIAGEGKAGLGPRIKAWKAHNKRQGNSEVYWLGQSVNLSDSESCYALQKALDKVASETEIKLIIIDTFSRNSGDADENSNKDVKIFMRSLDYLQRKYSCSVLLIHHVGKDPSKGIRGASAFTGDTETTICLEHVMGGIKMTVPKQKDAESPDPIHLVLHPVLYGNNPEDNSIVLIKSDAPIEEEEENKVSSKKSVQTMYDVLIGKELNTTQWVNLAMEAGISSGAAYSAKKELYEVKKLVWYKKEGKLYYVPNGTNTARGGDDAPKPKSFADEILDVLKSIQQSKGQGATYDEWKQEYAKSKGFGVEEIKNIFSRNSEDLMLSGSISCTDGLWYTAER